jgi:trimethylamine--corrinoid protein Co-methyltransferase
MRQELSTTNLIDRTMRESWEKRGSKDMFEVARGKAIEILENYEATPLPDDVKKKIRDIVQEGEDEANEMEKAKKKKIY